MPPAVNTTSAGRGAEQLGDRLPGLLERGLRRPGRRVAARRVAERAREERRPSPRPPRAASAWSRRDRGRRRRVHAPSLRSASVYGRVSRLAASDDRRPGITVTPPGDTPDVSTQLRLVEAPEPASAPARAAEARRRHEGRQAARPRRGHRRRAPRRSTGATGASTPAPARVGRAGVAARPPGARGGRAPPRSSRQAS